MQCLKCGKESGRSKFCRSCREIKQNAVSIVSQNRGKLIRLLRGEYLTPDGFNKFILYTNNIIKYGKVVMEYKQVDTIRKFVNIINFGTYIIILISILFIGEIVITEL